jgi:putative ABC transport system permease protein
MSNPDTSTFYESGLSDPRVKCITFLDTECYNNLTGNKLELSNDEMALGSLGSGSWNPESIKIADMELKSKETIENPPISSEVASVVECYLMVVNEENFEKIFKDQEEKYGKGIGDEDYNGTRKAVDQVTDKLEGSRNYASQMTIRFAANVEGPEENISELYRIFVDKVSAITDDDYYTNVNWSSAVGMRGDLYDMNGSLMFLGMLLSLVCLISTAIIIYYKQISEGYEDRNNFQIMQKVGLTKEEIKKTIGNQILTVFFLPLIIAGIHTIVAYPMVKNIMKLFAMASEQMLLSCIGIVFAIFALVYVVIYRITAKTYYKIVK